MGFSLISLMNGDLGMSKTVELFVDLSDIGDHDLNAK